MPPLSRSRPPGHQLLGQAIGSSCAHSAAGIKRGTPPTGARLVITRPGMTELAAGCALPTGAASAYKWRYQWDVVLKYKPMCQ